MWENIKQNTLSAFAVNIPIGNIFLVAKKSLMNT